MTDQFVDLYTYHYQQQVRRAWSDQIKEYPIKEKIQDPIAASESQNKEYKTPSQGDHVKEYIRMLEYWTLMPFGRVMD